ncbi:sarcosine oxidase subunit gamma family protein [Aminobacter sp. P9b]|uniref:sarcosine oxidase subunit gamma family protein n=1 Tax=unclassified Aminobacter TaxID=2644704 RepID=UPI000D361BE6|nr:sarcosine oxidase subunit gamma family protein [Aminobacter sp. MSH1]AWC24054.1 sarcosine oxidase, gamma subunit family [Aminobacter sp. MSH1]
MRNLAEKWTAMPDWQTVVIDTPSFAIRSVSGLNQFLVSGDLAAWSRTAGIALQPVGAFGEAMGDTYTVQVARDRLLVVSALPSTVAQGWHEQGFAVTKVSAGIQVFEIEGAAAAELVARATTLDPGKASASAAISFAGINAVVYRHGERIRVHVDRSLAAYFWSWVATVGGNIASAEA